MKRLLFLSVLLALLIPLQADAEYFKCDLNLNVIEDTDSSERKQLVLEVDLNQDFKRVISGSMITSSCFNTFVDPFISDSSEFKKVSINNLIQGSVSSPKLAIGKYNYQLGLEFFQVSPEDSDGIISLKAGGKLLPLNNEEFIHQNIEGECYLSQEPFSSFSLKNIPIDRCNEINEL